MILYLLTGWSAYADEQTGLFAELPAYYSGTFQWSGDSELQQVSFIFETQEVDEGGNYLLLGQGLYISSTGQTAITIKSIVDARSYRIEIWEGLAESDDDLVIHGQTMDKADDSDFITEGSHVGVMTSSLKFIEATWTTADSGEQGVLKLQRGE
jgi:hypothetical protein